MQEHYLDICQLDVRTVLPRICLQAAFRPLRGWAVTLHLVLGTLGIRRTFPGSFSAGPGEQDIEQKEPSIPGAGMENRSVFKERYVQTLG